jgi:hypothetical protein
VGECVYGCVYVWVLECMLVSVTCVLVFTVFVCTVFWYCLDYVYVFLLVLSVLPLSDNSIAVNNNDNNILVLHFRINVCLHISFQMAILYLLLVWWIIGILRTFGNHFSY